MPSVTLDRATIHYSERGRGPNSIVLLHGFPLDSSVWDQVIPDPPPGWRVVTPDLTGFGRSSSDQAFTIDSLASDVHQLLKRIGCEPCVLGGLSMGGYVALAFVKKCPMKLRGLLLIDTRAEGDTAEGKEKRQKMIDLVGQKGSTAVADQMFPMMITKEHQADSAIAGPLRRMMEGCPPKTIERACAAMRDREDYTEFLPSIAVPTLIVVGEADAITPRANSESMQRAIPRSKLVTIPGVGHMTPLEAPKALSSAILEFVATCR